MSIGSIVVPGYIQTAVNEYVRANDVDSAYLATLEIPLLRGRDFNAHDTAANAARVSIVNQSFAKKYFGTEDVVGQHFGNAGNTALNIEIVGLMRDSRYSSVKSTVPPVAFFPFAQASANSIGAAQFAVRFAGSETPIVAAIRGAMHEIDANVPITNLRTQDEQIDRLFTQERLFANLCSVFGGLALVLSAVGLYGLMSYAVLRRTGEIGLRMALGALPAHVLKMILRESLALVVLGILVGVGAAMGATRWVASMLFGLTPNDPVTYVCVALLLLAVATAACLLPARRAAKIDPMIALRTE
jgi:predicted permease